VEGSLRWLQTDYIDLDQLNELIEAATVKLDLTVIDQLTQTSA
jgi:hypothetical protein